MLATPPFSKEIETQILSFKSGVFSALFVPTVYIFLIFDPINAEAKSIKCQHSPINRPPPITGSWIKWLCEIDPALTRIFTINGLNTDAKC